MTGPVVERIRGSKRGENFNGRWLDLADGVRRHLLEDEGLEDMGLVVMAVGVERGLEVVEGGRPIAALAVDGGELVVGATTPFVVPGGLVQGPVGGMLVAEPALGEAEVVVGFAADGVGVAAGEAGDGGAGSGRGPSRTRRD